MVDSVRCNEMRHLHKKSDVFRSKKFWFISGVTIVALLICVYLWLSFHVWAQLDEKANSSYSVIGQKATAILAMSTKTTEDKIKKRTALVDLSTTIKQAKDDCKVEPLYSWQQIISVNNDKMLSCKQLFDNPEKFANSLDEVTAHMKNAEQVAGIISKAAKAQDSVPEDEWAATQKQWADAEKSLSEMKIEKSFSKTKKLAVDKVHAIQIAWQKIIVANQAQDRAQYEQATQSLTTAYGGVKDIADSSNESLEPLIENLDKAYRNAF